MRVTRPSTSGWIVVERSDRSVAMNSDASSIGFGASVMVVTALGGGAAALCAGAPPRPHAAAASAGTQHASAKTDRVRKREYCDAMGIDSTTRRM